MRLARVHTVLFAAACALAAGSAACATSAGNKAGKKDYQVVCADEAPTGSHISRLKCWRVRDVHERTAKDRATMEKIQYDTARRQDASGQGATNPTNPRQQQQQIVVPAVSMASGGARPAR